MSEPEIDLTQFVEGQNGISVIRTQQVMEGEDFRGWNGIKYKAGLSSKNVNAKHLSMNVATIAPGAIAYAHIHDGFELMLYILQGNVRHIYGTDLEHTIDNESGDFIYIEPGVPHEVYNLSDSEPVMAGNPDFYKLNNGWRIRFFHKKNVGGPFQVRRRALIVPPVEVAGEIIFLML